VHRVCFQLQVRPERIEEYTARHREVWPEMLDALAATGWHNYSLFLRGDGLLIGYFETPSLEHAVAGMAATEVNARWQSEMAEFFSDLGTERPTQDSCSCRRSSTSRTSSQRPPEKCIPKNVHPREVM